MRLSKSREKAEKLDHLWDMAPKSGCCDSGMFERVIWLRGDGGQEKAIAKFSVCIDCKRRFGSIRVLDPVFRPEHQEMADQVGCDIWCRRKDGSLGPSVSTSNLAKALAKPKWMLQKQSSDSTGSETEEVPF